MFVVTWLYLLTFFVLPVETYQHCLSKSVYTVRLDYWVIQCGNCNCLLSVISCSHCVLPGMEAIFLMLPLFDF